LLKDDDDEEILDQEAEDDGVIQLDTLTEEMTEI
jgi:hypothetical protein